MTEPQIVVAESRAGAKFHAFVPPMQHIALGELVCGMVEDLSAGVGGIAVKATHHILQLVAETRGTANLIETGTGEQAGGIHLIQIPAVQHVVERTVGGVHFRKRKT